MRTATSSRRDLLAYLLYVLANRAAFSRTAGSHLDRAADRAAFSRWFAFLAEAQYFTPASKRPPEIVDCSSLLRFAYREALRRHDTAWAAQIGAPMIPAIPQVEQYNFPYTPTGANLFRIGPQRYAQFADAGTLFRYNTDFVSRDLFSAAMGDLVFYRHEGRTARFHSMIVIGRSQISREETHYVVYDTGPDGTNQGEIKRLSFDELLHFPDPAWRPLTQNPAFLGVFRWNIVN